MLTKRRFWSGSLFQSDMVSVVCLMIPPRVYYQSFIYVICFLFYAVPNCKHATSNFPFSSSSKPYLFSLECLQTRLVLRLCHLCAPLGRIRLSLPVKIGIFEISCKRSPNQHARPGKCHPIVPSSACGP